MNQIETISVNFEGNKKHKIEDAFKIVKETIKKYNENNYKVVSVTPLTSSDYYSDDTENKSFGYGYSFTSAIIIVFEKKE